MRMCMKATLALVALSLSLTAPVALAEDDPRWYQVEVLIFENPDYRAERPEHWPSHPVLNRRSPAISIEREEDSEFEVGLAEPLASDLPPENADDAETPPQPFEPLGPDEFQMAEAREQLEQSRGFRILHHQAWRQPVPGRDDVIPIRIRAGDTFGQNRELQGYLELYVERYLHLTADLQLIRYTQTDNPFRLIDERADPHSDLDDRIESFSGLTLNTDTDRIDNAFVSQSEKTRYYVAVESIRMNEKRRMRSGEIHYLDNPEFGLLFLVTPLEFEVPPAPDQE